GALSFVSAPDYETDAHSYAVTVKATDGGTPSLFTTQNVTVNLADVNDNTPSITSSASFLVDENTPAVGTVVATDADATAPNNSIVYSISGVADASLFSINVSTGALSFVSAPDYEGGQTSFAVQVKATDGGTPSLFTTLHASPTRRASDLNTPSITSSASFLVDENTTAVGTVVATDADATAPNNSI